MMVPRKERVGEERKGVREGGAGRENTGIKGKDKDVFSEYSVTHGDISNPNHNNPFSGICFVVLGVEPRTSVREGQAPLLYL